MGTRTYATINCSIWDDEDFIALSGAAQATYFMLTSQTNIEACGSIELTLRRWSKYVAKGDVDQLVASLNELHKARFVVLDKDTEELLVRTFARYDGGYRHAVRVKAVVTSAHAIRSAKLREVIAAELDRLGVSHKVPGATRPGPESLFPASGDVPESLTSALDVPVESLPSATQEAPDTHPTGTGQAPESHRSVVNVRNHHRTPHSALLGGEPAAPDTVPPELPPSETCPAHPGGTDEPCGPCKAARLAHETWKTDQAQRAKAEATQRRKTEREARATAIRNCDLCGPDGYRLGLDTPAPCNHQPLNPGGLARALAEISGGTT